MNLNDTEFETMMTTSDHMIFLYVFDSEQEKSKQMNSQIVSPVLDEMKGYFKFLAFNCQEEEIKIGQRFKEMCAKDTNIPFFQIIKPPEVKINPYTGKPMLASPVPYNDNQVTVPKFKSYILSNLPDFSVKLDTLQKLQDFQEAKDDSAVNRVLLFSKKSKTPPIYKVLSSEFRDRIRFGFVEAEKSEELVRLFKDQVTEYPSIIVLQSFNITTNQTLEVVPVLKYDKKDYKLDELKTYLSQFARNEKIEAPVKEQDKKNEAKEDQEQQQTTQRKQKKPYAELYTDRHFNTQIADNEKAALVFYITSQNITSDVPLFDKILK